MDDDFGIVRIIHSHNGKRRQEWSRVFLTFSGSSGLIRRTCAEPAKARWFQDNLTLEVECIGVGFGGG